MHQKRRRSEIVAAQQAILRINWSQLRNRCFKPCCGAIKPRKTTTGANLASMFALSAPEPRAANNIITGKRHGIA
jgi:hypothetical protein